MIRPAFVLAIFLATFVASAEETFAPQVVIVGKDARAFAAQWPPAAAQLESATAVYVWTNELPIRRFTREEFVRDRAILREVLARGVSGTQRVRVRTATKKRKLDDVVLRYAPPDVWLNVPEPLLPEAIVSEEGAATLPYRESTLRIRASRKGESTSWLDIRASQSVLALELLPAIDAHVVLRGEGAIENASATLLLHERGVAQPVMTAQYLAAAKGVLDIASIPQTDVVTLMLFARDYAPASITGVAEDISRTIDLVRAGALRGRFVDRKGKPVSGVRVAVEAWIADDLPAVSRVETTSDAEGKWVLRDLPRREATLFAHAKAFATYRDLATPSSPETDLGDIELTPASPLVLEVVDDKAEPVVGARVRLSGIRAGTTNEKGIITIADASSLAPADITIEHDAFEKTNVTFDPPFAKSERVTLVRRFLLRGRLVDESNAAVPDARALIEVGNSYRTQSLSSDGTFEIAATRGQEVRLTFESATTVSHTRTEPPGEAGETRDLGTIRLDRGNIVRGRIVNEASEPVADARLWVLRPTMSGPIGSWIAQRSIETRSRTDGSFELSGVDTGSVSIRIDARGFARAQRDVVAEAQVNDVGEIVLSRGSELVVTMKTNASDATARVDLTGSWSEVDMLTASVLDGKATVRNVPPGDHIVTVARATSVICEKNVSVPKDGRRIEVVCGAPTRVSGQVLIGTAPVSGGALSWTRVGRVQPDSLINTTLTDLGTRRQQVFGAGTGLSVVEVDARGRFSSDELLPGSWSVTWSAPDGATVKARRIDIPDAPNAELTLRYDGAMVSGIVVDAQTKPVAMARIQTDDGQFAFSHEDGTFRLAGLLPGRYTVQARKGDLASRRAEIVVSDDEPIAGLDLALDPNVSEAVRVRVVTASGDAASNAFVFVDTELGSRILTTDASGEAKATFAAGRPSNVRLAAFHRGVWTFAVPNAKEATHVLRQDVTGGVNVTTRSAVDAPRLLTPSGVDVLMMLSRLGIPASLAPDAPLHVAGLPPGRYTLIAGNETRIIDITGRHTSDIELP